jgi:hypothetical protein
MHPLDERRAETRNDLSRPCKVFDPRTGRYVAGCTRDLSSHGVQIETQRRMHLEPGETLFVGIALKRRDVLLARNEMCEGRVMRAMHTPDGRTVIGMRLDGGMQQLRPAA